MKLFGKLLIAALVLATLLPFTFLKGKDGRPLMSLDNLKFPSFAIPDISLPQISSETTEQGAVSPSNGGSVIYEWRNQQGELNFTTMPPPKGVDFTQKSYDPNMNLIQSVKVKPEQVETVSSQSRAKQVHNIGNPYAAGKVEKLMDDAQNIENLLNDRFKKQEAMLGQ